MALLAVSCGLYVPPEEPTPHERLPHLGSMALVPAKDSSFVMGSNTNPEGDVCLPLHTVKFTYDYWIDTAEVTQGDYDGMMSALYPGFRVSAWDPTYGSGAMYPANDRNWYDAILYCNARSKQDGFDTIYSYTAVSDTPGSGCQLSNLTMDLQKSGYRMPTEAEWEYACRAGYGGDYYWGRADAIAAYAWYDGSSGGKTHQVAQKLPNAYGLYDMGGNVGEWCNDVFAVYLPDPVTDPAGSAYGTKKVIRGGSFTDVGWVTGSSTRNQNYPTYRSPAIGFRAVRRAYSSGAVR